MARVGILWPAASPPAPPRMEWFTQALRQLGFTEGRNLAIELRYAQGGPQQIPELAAELAGMKVDVIAAFGDLAPKAVQQASTTIPIVAMADDILGAGIVTSLSRPGVNTTGVTIMAPELSEKRLEVVREMLPGVRRVAALWDPTTGASQVSTTERAARTLKLELQILEVRRREDVVGALQPRPPVPNETNREVGRLGAFEDFGHERCGLPPQLLKARPIGYQAPGLHMFLPLIDCRKPVFS